MPIAIGEGGPFVKIGKGEISLQGAFPNLIRNLHLIPLTNLLLPVFLQIREQGKGYCADYSQVFTALALSTGIPVREWGLGFEGFGRGHAFNEVYDSEQRKWVFIDSYHSLYVIDRGSHNPLSTIEFHNQAP